ncbi:hypothetical protein [Acidovorax sp. SUPP2825]|uniref:hypothetical protein n=1 Tax=Acidovorax sp. SUPP2825 TaxID=2920879 RepID=UPI0023DE571A|nr:hypothetical protein [Acidovorax sp. SUPP2825]GKS93486.1 hypothetical protein AVAK2825_03145 [Acidovorax sp. SUPP2825]
MPSALRPIAIHVQEPSPGDFRWVLMEREGGGAWAEMERSASAAGTYHQALADGLRVLQAMIEDLDIGPRLAVKRAAKAVAPSDDAPQTDRAPADPPTPSKPSLFGFGPAR